MPGTIVVGAQWGDEGKGKIVDILAEKADMVVRFQGGNNAGHTLVVNGQKTVLHLIPSGVLHPSTTCVVASAVVLDIFGLADEIRKLKAAGFLKNPQQLLVSDNCTVILPFHKTLDAAREAALSTGKIGTTGKGIGPAYEDRAARRAILFGDLYDPSTLMGKLEHCLSEKNFLLEQKYKQPPVNVPALMEQILPLAEELAPYRCHDTSLAVSQALRAGRQVLFEGAQGTLLDIFHGTYPYVTSSSTVAGSACVGTGIGPTSIEKVIGLSKAYTTRVGSGPFPTELDNSVGEKLRKDGHEFGSTTGRPRRCGWLDLVALKYAIRVNGITHLALMKLDVLAGHEKVGVCTGYKLNGKILKEFPNSPYELAKVEPVIEYLPGWSEDLTKITSRKQLPATTTGYVDFVAKELGVPIDVVSVGPGREQTL